MSIEVKLGERLRFARKQRGMTLKTISQELGVSSSLLSQIENGHVQPSVPTLYSLVTLLDVSVDMVLGIGSLPTPPTTEVVKNTFVFQRAKDNPVSHMGEGVTWEALASDPASPGSSGFLVTYDQHEGDHGSHTERLQHSGAEYCVIVQGELTLYIGDDVYQLRPGDSLHFDSSIPHLYVNHGYQPVRGIWHVSGELAHS
jgi:transcriptional regulator with XRE-family HTH domain